MSGLLRRKAALVLVNLEAFRTISPYKDVFSPLRRSIEPSTEWRYYQFQIDEGKDFFADEARYLLLAFRPTQTPCDPLNVVHC